jgi:hypothetical protein
LLDLTYASADAENVRLDAPGTKVAVATARLPATANARSSRGTGIGRFSCMCLKPQGKSMPVRLILLASHFGAVATGCKPSNE